MSLKFPRHIAIIMDGNGRWAAKRGLMRIEGHRAGAESVRKITTFCAKSDVEILTLYAFSNENWNRPQKEVGLLMKLLEVYVMKERRTIMDNNIRLQTIGDTSRLPEYARRPLKKLIELSSKNTGMILQLALSYGSRDEIVRASKQIAKDAIEGKIDPDKMSEQKFSEYLDTAGQVEPDLLIRTGGELRISNYLLWQSAYSEFYFTDCNWPDFDEAALTKAVEEFHSRERKFGHVEPIKVGSENTKEVVGSS